MRHTKLFMVGLVFLAASTATRAATDATPPIPTTPPSTAIECKSDDNTVVAGSVAPGTTVSVKPSTDGQKTAKDDASETLQKFAVSSGSGSTIVTSHIASAYAPMNEGDKPGVNLWNDLGFDVSASVNAQNQTESDYLRQEILTRYGGVGNLYLSLAGRNACNPLYHWGDRLRSLDHIYPLDQLLNQAPNPNQLLVFVSHGVGIKAIKESTDGSHYTGMGSAYLGIGIDGPLFSFNSVSPVADGDKSGSSTQVSNSNGTGFVSWEFYVSENIAQQSVISTMFNAPNAKGSFSTWGTIFRAGIGGCFDISVTYSSAIGKPERQYLPGTTLVSFGYNRPSDKGSTC